MSTEINNNKEKNLQYSHLIKQPFSCYTSHNEEMDIPQNLSATCVEKNDDYCIKEAIRKHDYSYEEMYTFNISNHENADSLCLIDLNSLMETNSSVRNVESTLYGEFDNISHKEIITERKDDINVISGVYAAVANKITPNCKIINGNEAITTNFCCYTSTQNAEHVIEQIHHDSTIIEHGEDTTKTIRVLQSARKNSEAGICDKQNLELQCEQETKQANKVMAEPLKEITISPINKTEIELNQNVEKNTQLNKKKKFPLKEKISRKRKRDKENWKVEVSKKSREAGEEYVTKKGKVIKEKKICEGLLCTEKCRLRCSSNFSIEDRQELLSQYYSLSINLKNAILFKSIQPCAVKRHLVDAKKVRNQSYTYHIKKKNNDDIKICKTAFLNLYQISARKIQVIQNKHENGQLLPNKDIRGRHSNRPNKLNPDVKEYVKNHIKSFPSEDSHYSRNVNPNKRYLSPLLNIKIMHKLFIEKCKNDNNELQYFIKECTYRHIFCTEFNLSFGLPRSDVCSKCETIDPTVNIDLHKELYQEAYQLMKLDRNDCSNDEEKLYCTVDIQQTMPLPKMPVGEAFYLRQIWFYNLGIHLVNKDHKYVVMCTWTEDIAKKGSVEVSCALLYLSLYLQSKTENNKVKHLIIWSDSCSGQNKNFNLICLYQYLIYKKYFNIIDHKFPVVGHTYLDSDRDFGRIEKALRKHEKIYSPEEYREIIKKSVVKNSQIIDMMHHRYDIESLPQLLQLVNRTKNVLSHKVEFRDEVRWIRIEEFGSYLYKKSYDHCTPFLKVDVKRKKKSVDSNIEIQRLTKLRGDISNEKKADIRKQLKYIPMEKRFFYDNILNN